jgi:hypothetical protein
LVWTVRSPTVTGSLEEWTTFSPIPFSGVTITVNIGSAGFNGLVAWAVAGQKAFDGSPVAGFPPPPMQISTTNPYCLIFAAARFTATADPIIGPGWSLVDSPAGGFLSVEYQIVSAPQTNLVGAFTSTDLGAEFMDALTTDPPGLAGPDFTQSPILQVRNPAFIY